MGKKPVKEKKHFITKNSTQADIDAAWSDAASTAATQTDTCVTIQFDPGNYRLPAIASGTVTIVGDDLQAGTGGVIVSVYTDGDSGQVVIEYTAVPAEPV